MYSFQNWILKMYKLLTRGKILINTDPQRRCYNGAHYSSELINSPWEILRSGISENELDGIFAFWTDLNEYAVSQRGESARKEFKFELEE